MSQLKICDFSGETFKGYEGHEVLFSPVVSFANCVMTLYLLKVQLQTFPSVPITQKCQILGCDTLVTNEQFTECLK